MRKQYKIAMFGSGKIAYKISEAIMACDDRIVRYSVVSRVKQHAERFANENNFQKVYESYDELLADQEIDFVYISTPTQLHYEHMKMCLLAGKNVICEKPFALNAAEAKELVSLAEAKGLICMDAMWSMYMPMWHQIAELLKEGAIGVPKFLSASFGYPNMHIPRLMDEKGGGAFYDLGVYCVTAALKVLGTEIQNIKASFEYVKNVDVVNKVHFSICNCKVRIHSSIKHRDSYMFLALGTKGMIFSRKYWQGKRFYFLKYPFSMKKYTFVHEKNGYEYELKEMIHLLDEERTDSNVWGHRDTMNVVECMDTVRKEAKRKQK